MKIVKTCKIHGMLSKHDCMMHAYTTTGAPSYGCKKCKADYMKEWHRKNPEKNNRSKK